MLRISQHDLPFEDLWQNVAVLIIGGVFVAVLLKKLVERRRRTTDRVAAEVQPAERQGDASMSDAAGTISRRCWFCNAVNRIPSASDNQWYCCECEQYNGFGKDGDYNKPMYRMSDSRLNPVLERQDPGAPYTSETLLCPVCISNEQLKLRRLRELDDSLPQNDAEAERCYRIAAADLEQKFPLCEDCHDRVACKIAADDQSNRSNRIAGRLLRTRRSQRLPGSRKSLIALRLVCGAWAQVCWMLLALLCFIGVWEVLIDVEVVDNRMFPSLSSYLLPRTLRAVSNPLFLVSFIASVAIASMVSGWSLLSYLPVSMYACACFAPCIFHVMNINDHSTSFPCLLLPQNSTNDGEAGVAALRLSMSSAAMQFRNVSVNSRSDVLKIFEGTTDQVFAAVLAFGSFLFMMSVLLSLFRFLCSIARLLWSCLRPSARSDGSPLQLRRAPTKVSKAASPKLPLPEKRRKLPVCDQGFGSLSLGDAGVGSSMRVSPRAADEKRTDLNPYAPRAPVFQFSPSKDRQPLTPREVPRVSRELRSEYMDKEVERLISSMSLDDNADPAGRGRTSSTAYRMLTWVVVIIAVCSGFVLGAMFGGQGNAWDFLWSERPR